MLCASACDELGEQFEYRGSRLLDEGDYHVSTAHWLDTLPVVFASRREEPGQPRVLRFVPLADVGIEPCSTMSGTGFIAVGHEGGFRVAVLNDVDEGRELDFFDARCRRVGPAFDDASRIDYIADLHFLVRTVDDSAYVVEPFDGRVELLGRNVEAVGLPRTQAANEDDEPEPLSAWVLDDRGLQLLDMRARPLTRLLPGAVSLALYKGLTRGATHMIAYRDDGGVHVAEYDPTAAPDDDGLLPLTELWGAEDACGHTFYEVQDPTEITCEGPDCIATEQPAVGGGFHAWIGSYQPCDSRRLVLRRIDDGLTFVVDEGVREHRVATLGTEDGPVTVYGKDVLAEGDDEPRRVFYFRNGTQPPIEIDVPLDLQLTSEDLSAFPRLRIITAEQPRRFGLWEPETGFQALRENVHATQTTSMVLHGFDSETRTGTLSLCAGTCFDVATGVRAGSYRKYTALERIGDGAILLAYIHGYAIDPDSGRGGGTMTVVDTEKNLSVDLDTDVSSFVPIENGPARGIVYATSDPDRQGLWFAPR